METRFALLLACFFLSGFAALLYETAWLRELGFVFGTSELAVAAVLAAYMGGLALGAAAAAPLARRLRRPVLAYGLLELAIAACALAVPVGIGLLTHLYVALFGGHAALPASPPAGTALFQLLGAFAVLVPPTALMGATLPLLARHAVRREAQIGPRVGLLYAVNTAGAIAGTLAAAFALMPALGLRHTVYVGAAVNALVFLAAAALARSAPAPVSSPSVSVPGASSTGESSPAATSPAAGGTGWVLPAVAISGAVSFTYEVLWTRLLLHVLGSSVAAFATMLAGFLLGIALGSAVAARLASSPARAVRGFAAAQLGIALCAYGTFAGADRLPELARGLGVTTTSPLTGAALAAAVLLPLTLCVGATFPFAVRMLARHPEQAAGASARVYSASTLGAILGTVGAGFLLLPGLGFAGTLAVGAWTSLALAAVACLGAGAARQLPLLGAAAGAALLLVVAPPRPPWTLLRTSPGTVTPMQGEIAYAGVGRSATVLLIDQGARWRLVSNGLPESRIDRPEAAPMDYVGQWLGLLPSLVRPRARDAVVVGLGGGLTLEALPSNLARADVIELEPEVVAANRAIAGERARDPLSDPRVHVHLGDARGALLLSDARYDVLVSQPSHPWTSGASHLYTREFFSLVRSRLRPGGVFVQWIGIQFVDSDLLRSLLASLLDVFPHVDVFRPNPMALLFAASDAPIDVLEGARVALDEEPDDFSPQGLYRLEDVAATWVLDTQGARALAGGAPPNTDDHNRIAARAARLGRSVLDPAQLTRLLEPHDPLRSGGSQLDRSALIRRLAATGFPERAEALAEGWQELQRELGLGWIELARHRPRSAASHFARARALDPGSRDALAGLVGSHRAALARGETVAELPEQDLDATLASLVAGWRRESAGDWTGLSALDPQLATLRPGDALFQEAARLRVRWRLETGAPGTGAEALEIADALVAWATWGGREPELGLLRARAAAAAGRSGTAWAALDDLAGQLLSDGESGLARQALQLAGALPEEPLAQRVRGRLEIAARRRQ